MNKKNKQQPDKNASKKQENKELNKENNKEEKLKEQLEEMENNWKRALADYKNLQRRTLKEKEDAVKFSNFVLISELISVYDNLLMVQKHSEDQGLDMIVDQFWEILERSGVEKINAENKDFNENTMEAVETDEGEEGKVLEVLQKGYKFKDRLLKPAKVIVGIKQEEKPEKDQEKKDT